MSKALNVNFSIEDRNNILRVIKHDTKYLASNNFMDYSLLFGIQTLDRGNMDSIVVNRVPDLKNKPTDISPLFTI